MEQADCREYERVTQSSQTGLCSDGNAVIMNRGARWQTPRHHEMNRRNLVEYDRKLSDLLRKNRPAPPLPPDFKNAVWRRIEHDVTASHAPVRSYLARLVDVLVRPRFAAAGLGAVLVLGLLMGAWQGQGHARVAARARYVASVAPWQEP